MFFFFVSDFSKFNSHGRGWNTNLNERGDVCLDLRVSVSASEKKIDHKLIYGFSVKS